MFVAGGQARRAQPPVAVITRCAPRQGCHLRRVGLACRTPPGCGVSRGISHGWREYAQPVATNIAPLRGARARKAGSDSRGGKSSARCKFV